jgi:hypothetical protein
LCERARAASTDAALSAKASPSPSRAFNPRNAGSIVLRRDRSLSSEDSAGSVDSLSSSSSHRSSHASVPCSDEHAQSGSDDVGVAVVKPL